MKHGLMGSLILAAAVALGTTALRAADNPPKDVIVGPLRTQWSLTKDLILNMAEAIPESKYDYKPVPEVRTFREQLTHLVSENMNYVSMVAGDPAPDRAKIEAMKSRDEILKALRDSYEYGERTLAKLTDEKAAETITMRNQKVLRWYPVLYNIQDNMDHYGNLVVYVRLNGMVPPKTAARQAQPQQR
jgi:uncharacterized damage-inducible protein DinB